MCNVRWTPPPKKTVTPFLCYAIMTKGIYPEPLLPDDDNDLVDLVHHTPLTAYLQYLLFPCFAENADANGQDPMVVVAATAFHNGNKPG